MIVGRAPMVSQPPVSWKQDDVAARGVAQHPRETTAEVPGWSQFQGSTSHMIVARPSEAAMDRTRSLTAPNGGRRQWGASPVNSSMRSLVRANWSWIVASE